MRRILALFLVTGLTAGTVLMNNADARTKLMDIPVSQNLITQGFTTTNTGLNYKDVAIGSGAEAKSGQNVTVHYTGWLYPQGNKFDSSVDIGRPYSFRLGTHHVIQGWDEGVAGMKVGGKRILIIPPQLGYGDEGYPGTIIKPNATLKFEVELLGVQ